MSESLSSDDDSSSSSDEEEIDYYKTEKLSELHKVELQNDSLAKDSNIKFRKTKIGFEPTENVLNVTAEEVVVDTLVTTRNDLHLEMCLGVEPMPFQSQADVWMSIEEFSLRHAVDGIEKFVSSWKMPSYWLYCVDFRSRTSDDVCVTYIFETKWSIPTKEKPIPRATASVYFTFEVSKIKPLYYPVDVSFSFECSRVVYRPGTGQHVTESMFQTIIDNKLLVSDTVTF